MNTRSAAPGALTGLAVISPGAVRSECTAPLLPGSGAAILFWSPEQQIVGYREMKKIAPTHVVMRGAHAHALRGAVPQISPQWTWNGQPMDVDRYMEAARTSGVIVVKDGQVVLERYGLGRTEEDLWYSQSVSKSLTSILVGAAIKDRYVKSMDELVTNYIPELKGSAYESVTVRQLLTMTSGVKYSEYYTDLRSDVFCLWSPVIESGVDPVVSYMRRLPRADEPGAKFEYSTADTHLAGILVCNAVGKPLSEYLSEKLWQPYGMEKDAVWTVDSAGYEYAGGGLSMCLRDYARIGQFMLDGGKAGGAQVLPPDWIAEATSAQVSFPAGSRRDDRVGYGYFWWIFKDSYAASGGFGQRIIVYPKHKVVIAINSAWLNFNQPSRPEYDQAERTFVGALHAAAVAHC